MYNAETDVLAYNQCYRRGYIRPMRLRFEIRAAFIRALCTCYIPCCCAAKQSRSTSSNMSHVFVTHELRSCVMVNLKKRFVAGVSYFVCSNREEEILCRAVQQQ